MKKSLLLLLLCLSLMITGCVRDADETKDVISSESITETAASSDAEEQNTDSQNGIYYPKEKEGIITQGVDLNTCYGQSGGEKYLHYNDSIYIAAFADDYYVEEEKISLKTILGNKISTVYGNSKLYWSIDSNELSKSTDEGILYQVNGYDTDYVVCIVWEEQYETMPSFEPKLHVTFYKKLNDITLAYGRDLFQDRMRLKYTEHVLGVSQYEFGGAHEQCDWEEGVPVTDPSVQKFLMALFEAEFLSKAEIWDIKDIKLNQGLSYTLVFRDSNGFIQSIKLYEDGYVRVSDAIVARMDSELCKKMIDWIRGYIDEL